MKIKKYKFTKEQQESFDFWMEDGNVIKNSDGTYSTQDSMYRNRLENMDALKEYFYNEFIKGQWDSYESGGSTNEKYFIEFLNKKKGFQRDRVYFDSFSEAEDWGKKNLEKFNSDMIRVGYKNGGSIDDKHLVAKAIEYITGTQIEKDSISYEANRVAFKYKQKNAWSTLNQKLIEDTIKMHRKSLEMRGNFEDGGEVEKVLFAVKIGEPDWAEQLITENESRIEEAKKWAEQNGFDRFRVAEIDMSKKPKFAKGGNVSSIEKKVAEVNRLINLANEKNISVVDSSSTWESPMKYKPIRYSNGVLYIEYQELDLYKYNRTGVSNWVTKKDKILKRDIEFDNPLNDIAKMYRKALREEGIDYKSKDVKEDKKEDKKETEKDNFDDAGTSMVMYHEKKGNFIVPKGQIYVWLYDVEGSADKLQKEEFDWVFYPYASQSMAWQKGFIPPLKKIWTKKFQKEHKGSENLLGVIKAYLMNDGKKLYIDMMSVNPTKKKKGIMSYMIKDLRDSFNLTQEQVEFSKLTEEGEKFVGKKTYGSGGDINPDALQYSEYIDSLSDSEVNKKYTEMTNFFITKPEFFDGFEDEDISIEEKREALKSHGNYADGGWVLVDADTERKLGEYETESEARKMMYEYEGNSEILEKSKWDKLPPNPNRHSPAYNFADGGGVDGKIKYVLVSPKKTYKSAETSLVFLNDEIIGYVTKEYGRGSEIYWTNSLYRGGKVKSRKIATDDILFNKKNNTTQWQYWLQTKDEKLKRYEGSTYADGGGVDDSEYDSVKEKLQELGIWGGIDDLMSITDYLSVYSHPERVTFFAYLDQFYSVATDDILTANTKDEVLSSSTHQGSLEENFNLYDDEDEDEFSKGGETTSKPTLLDDGGSVYQIQIENKTDDDNYQIELEKIKLLSLKSDFDLVKGSIEEDKFFLSFWKNGKRLFYINGKWYEEFNIWGKVYPAHMSAELVKEFDGQEVEFEWHPFNSMGGFDELQFIENLNKAIREVNNLSRANSELSEEKRLGIYENGGSTYADGGDVPFSDKMFHLPLEMVVYVPSTQDVDNVISVDDMDNRVNEVKTYLAGKFGGYTASDRLGGFVDSTGNLVNEDVVQVVSFSTKEDFENHKEELIKQIAEWGKKWGQEAIGFEFEGDLMYVPQELNEKNDVEKYRRGGFMYEVQKKGSPSNDMRETMFTAKNLTELKKQIIEKYGTSEGFLVRRRTEQGYYAPVKFENGGSTEDYNSLTRGQIEDKIAGLRLRIAKTKKQISGYETTNRGKYNNLWEQKVVPLQKELDFLANLWGNAKYSVGGAIYPDLSLQKADVVNDSVVLDEFQIKKMKNTFSIEGRENTKITSSKDSVDILRLLIDKDTINAYEQAYILYLNKNNKVIGYYHHSSGGIDGTIMDVQMISGMALKSLAKGVIIAHNHPSENTLPSDADKRITTQLQNALKLFNIVLLDSIILTNDGYSSFADNGLM
jgi:DNA repair protein RadC